MGITKYGIWAFFRTKEEAETTAKDLNSFGNKYGLIVIDKLRVLEGNSLRFFVANLQTLYQVEFRLDSKFCFINKGKKWELSMTTDFFKEEAKEVLEFINKKSKKVKR